MTEHTHSAEPTFEARLVAIRYAARDVNTYEFARPDGVPLLDVNLSQLLAMLFGSFNGRTGLGGPMEWEVLMMGFLGASLNQRERHKE